MQRTILVTGSTDGIGLETARVLRSLNHNVLLHGRNPVRLREAELIVSGVPGAGTIEGYLADFSCIAEVEALAGRIAERHSRLDTLINNAGVYCASEVASPDGLDHRFAVNTVAPYLLTLRLLPLLGRSGRVVNVSSAAQAPVNLQALAGNIRLPSAAAYAQSKLALMMWTQSMARSLGDLGPAILAVNPGSMLGSKMMREAFRIVGKDIGIGADILSRAALHDEFASASGCYFDNDRGQWAQPHPDSASPQTVAEVVDAIESILERAVSQQPSVPPVACPESHGAPCNATGPLNAVLASGRTGTTPEQTTTQGALNDARSRERR